MSWYSGIARVLKKTRLVELLWKDIAFWFSLTVSLEQKSTT